MKIKLRLYKYHDPELVQIYRLQSVDFEQLAMECLRAFSRNEFFRYRIELKGECRPAKRVHQVTINVDEKTEPEVYAILKKADDGCMNAFIKTILKWYLSDPMPAILLKKADDSLMFKQKCAPKFMDTPDIDYTAKAAKRVRKTAEKKPKTAESGSTATASSVKTKIDKIPVGTEPKASDIAVQEQKVTQTENTSANERRATLSDKDDAGELKQNASVFMDISPGTESKTVDAAERIESEYESNSVEDNGDEDLTDMFLSMTQG